jgi:hypothetical protein
LVGAVGIEIASLTYKSNKENGVAPPPHSNWSLLEPRSDKLNHGRTLTNSRPAYSSSAHAATLRAVVFSLKTANSRPLLILINEIVVIKGKNLKPVVVYKMQLVLVMNRSRKDTPINNFAREGHC